MAKRDGLGRLLAAALICAAVTMIFAVSSASAEPPSGPPVNSTLPTVKGKAVDGKKVHAASGSWAGSKPFSYSYAWERCDASGDECDKLSGAGSVTYKLSSQDVGHTLRAIVTAKNADGSATATSKPSAKVAAAGPKGKPATISGTAQDGQLVTVGTGTWKGTTPMAFGYQWQSCVKGACSSIPGAIQSTYRAASGQLGQKLRVLVTATNAAGSSTAKSKTSGAIAAGPPVALGAPGISGSPQIGET
ncbi:MAG TPA: hypothetical protein VGD00_02665, partial [Solirubrobacteraceae bacterium]